MASDSLELFSSEAISISELESLLGRMGGQLVNSERREWVISSDTNHAWVFLQSNESLDDEAQRLVTQALGVEPMTRVLVEVHRNEIGQRLAVEFLWQCVTQWLCVVLDGKNHLYTAADVTQLRTAGHGLSRLFP